MNCAFCDKNKALLSFKFGYFGRLREFQICEDCAGLGEDGPVVGITVRSMIYELQERIEAEPALHEGNGSLQ